MVFLGVQLTILIGPTVPKPASRLLLESLTTVEVTNSDTGRSGFQMSFTVSPSGKSDLDYPLLKQVKQFNRVVLVVIFNGKPQVLSDGIITNQQLQPSTQPGVPSTITVTGEDVSVMMDMEEKIEKHPSQNQTAITMKIIGKYAKYGLIPKVKPPSGDKPPLPTEYIPIQYGTDLQYILEMAERNGYVFYISPGPLPLTNTAYWGPPPKLGVPQSAISVNMGWHSNVDSINFQYDGLAASQASGELLDRKKNKPKEVKSAKSKSPSLASSSALKQPVVRKRLLPPQGLNQSQAKASAQSITDTSLGQVLTVEGVLDAQKYGSLLRARGLVGLRGAGKSYDGLYYVKSVTHTLEVGTYKQKFVLTREGLGTTVPVVKV
ncbi:phage late control D family protein [Moorena producens]|uniref:phage late control D family protein n=1 Tax=Moorena producens TaxID=1155739 RepID=UPI003C7119CB